MENTTTPAAPAPSAEISKDAKTFGMLCHLAALAGFIIPMGSIVGPLIIWLIKKNEMPFVDDQGKESLNFQITVFIAILVCIPLSFIIIGIPLMFVIAIGALVFAIIAAMKANEGIAYRYPWALRLIK
jgi:uncharacterized protein